MASVHPLPPMASAPPHAPNLPGGTESSSEEALVVSPHLPEGATINLTAPGTPVVRRLADSLRRLVPAVYAAALPVLLCPSPARYHVKRWLEPVMPRLAVEAASEIPPEIRLRPVGTVR
jgi:flagellar biosynthesis protein FlhA